MFDFSLEEIEAFVLAYVVPYTIKAIVAIAIFIIGKWLANKVAAMIKRVMANRNIDPTVGNFIGNILYGLLLVVVVIAALGQVGIQTASFVAVIGAAGLAVGLALQGSLSNFAAGVMLILLRPIKAGDFIDAGGAMGVVKEVDIFATKITTGDNKLIIVPNSSILGGNITNFSAMPTRRVDITFGCSYDDDIREVKAELESIIASNDKILKDPAPVVQLHELADSSVNFITRSWVNSADYWAVYWYLFEQVKLRFDEKGISIPYPQMDVHMDKPEPAKQAA